MLRAWLSVIAVIFVSGAWDTRAENAPLTGRQNEILRTAINSDGWLTEDMHREFWAAIPSAFVSEAQHGIAWQTVIDNMGGSALRFQRETWKSAKLSLDARRPIRTQEFEQARRAILSSSAFRAAPAQTNASLRNADLLIEAAAYGRPMTTPQGTIYITSDLIDKTIAGIDGSFCRFQRLFRPRWDPSVEERNYPDARVRILSPCPFKLERSEITLEGGRTTRMVNLTSIASAEEHMGINFVPTEGVWVDPQGSAIRTAQSTLKGLGIGDARPTGIRWRDHVSAVAAGSALTSQGAMHVSLRVIAGRGTPGAWTILSVTSKSLVDAVALRESLEASLQLISQ